MAEENNNLLFSDDVLSEVEASSLGGKMKTGPVTVLGKTFANDEERVNALMKEYQEKMLMRNTLARKLGNNVLMN